MKKRIISLCLMLILVIGMAFQNVIAFESNIDITPPSGTISITSADVQDGVNYVQSRKIEVSVTASSDTTQVYLSTTPITGTEKITSWETYTAGYKKNIDFPDGTTTLNIYVALKDARGNISTIFSGVNTQYNIVYNANNGTNAPSTQIGYFGMPFKITNERPTYAGKYFMGWSLDSTATEPTYIQGSTIPAEVFTGTEKNITLYAIWADTINELPLLSERVKVGDYVNYPVYYENVNSTTMQGWRVISKDVDLDGNTSIGTVNLISAGIPLTYFNGTEGNTSITNLTINFLTTNESDSEANTYRKNGFTSYANLKETFKNKYTSLKDDGTTPKVRSMNENEILNVTNKTSITTGTTMGLTEAKYQNLFNNGSIYWIASQGSTGKLRYISEGSINEDSSKEYGIRPVVSLKNTVATTGVNNVGAWDIEVIASLEEEEVNSYTVTFDGNGGTPETQTKIVTEGRKYGELPTVTRVGYEFMGWFDTVTGENEVKSTTIVGTSANGQTLYAKWQANTNTAYVVEYWLQNLNGEEEENETKYTKLESATENLTGTTGEIAETTVKEFAGFKSPAKEEDVRIKADGSTVIKYYYTRNSYNLTLTAGENIASVSGAGTYQYGKTITINATLAEEEGYEVTFDGWYLNGEKNQTTQKVGIVMPSGNVEFEARATKISLAFAIYSETDNSLRFYNRMGRPEVGETFNGLAVTEIYTGFEDGYTVDEPTHGFVIKSTPWPNNITKVIVEDKIKPRATSGWFAALSNVEEFVLDKLDMSEVNDTSFMFAGASIKNNKLDLSNWNTENIEDMWYMFYDFGFNSAQPFTLDLSGWDTSSVTDMSYMFRSAGRSATTFSLVGLSGWDTSNVTNMNGMFERAGFSADEWNIGDLSNWDTSKVTDMRYMFEYAGFSAEPFALNLSGWDTRKVTISYHVFGECIKLKEITVGENFTLASELPIPSAEHIPGADGYWYNKATGQRYLPSEIPENTAATYTAISPIETYTVELDANGGTIDSVKQTTIKVEENGVYGELPTPKRYGYTFLGWYTAKENGTLINANTSVQNSNHVIYAQWVGAVAIYSSADNSLTFCRPTEKLTVGDTYNGITITELYEDIEFNPCKSVEEIPWHDKRGTIESIELLDEIAPISTAYWFTNFTEIYSMDLTKLDTSNSVDTTSMFDGMTYLEEITLGEKFSFEGNGTTDCTLPEPKEYRYYWFSMSDLYNYDYVSDIPSYVAETYKIMEFCCFVPGTQVLVSLDGETKAIEEFKEGDKIVSYNVETGANYIAEVQGLIINSQSIRMARVYLEDGRMVDMTEYHPLYTSEGFHSITNYNGYDTLVVGDIAKTIDGWSEIIAIELYETEPIKTYNLSIKDYDEVVDNEENDCYYVNGMLAHNSSSHCY